MAARRRQIPLRRAAHPEEIAEAIVWLLSERASYVTGTVLKVATPPLEAIVFYPA